MNQEEKKEQAEAVETEEKEQPAAEQDAKPAKPVKKNLTPYLLIVAALVIGIMSIINLNKNKDGTQSCVVVPQAAFGQSQAQVWTELESPATAQAIAKFTLEVPETPSQVYTDAHYYVYTQQIYEIRYLNSNGEEGLRIAKGIMCGSPVYDVNETYRSTNIVDVGDKEVTEYGDGTNISIATWVSGEYSYCIGAWNAPLSKDAMEQLITQVQ